MIYKTIHYCWFGRNPKTALIKKCMQSWKKFCPDYEIIEWNEDNFDINCCDYVREAYEAKKWAFVSDYCRFYVLYHKGGIYLDTDVELIKPIDSLGGAFVGFENADHVASGLIRGAESGDIICMEMLKSYHDDHFKNNDGTLNLMTVCARETEIMAKHGLKRNDQYQIVENTAVYPSEYFNPTDNNTGKVTITPNTISIHHYAASWVSKNNQIRGKIAKWFYKTFGIEKANKIRKILGRKK